MAIEDIKKEEYHTRVMADCKEVKISHIEPSPSGIKRKYNKKSAPITSTDTVDLKKLSAKATITDVDHPKTQEDKTMSSYVKEINARPMPEQNVTPSRSGLVGDYLYVAENIIAGVDEEIKLIREQLNALKNKRAGAEMLLKALQNL